MAKNININRGINDPYYRYKMPRILAKVEGKGNGIKTVVSNMSDIAKALERPPTYPTKYFGCELGAQTNFDLKNDRYIVNGEHDANKLQDILDGFIKKFVLCPACENPETALIIKHQTINSRCKACGHTFVIDPKHKLSTFIIKNPPPKASSETDSKERRENGSPNGETNANEDTLIGSENNFHSNGNNGFGEDDDWAPLPDEEQEKLSAQVGKLILDRDLEKSVDERLDMLHDYFIKSKKDGTIQDFKNLVNEAERLELKTKAPLLLVDVLFDTDVVKQIQVYRALLLRFCYKDSKAQRHLLGGIEQLINKNKDVLLPKSAHIIKALYDNDICDEESLLGWGSKPSRKYVGKEFAKEIIKVAQPFLTWLEEAEEDSETEESDDGDGAAAVKVDFDERSRNLGTTITTDDLTNGGDKSGDKEKVAIIQDENGADIDIDDI